jgi:SAM-dependent methyltransferase
LKRLIRAVFEPFAKVFRVFFDPRFDQLGSRLERRLDDMSSSVIHAQEEARAVAEAVVEVLTFLNRNTREFADSLAEVTDPGGRLDRASSELDRASSELDRVSSELDRLINKVESLERHITAVPETLDLLGQRDAVLLNHAESHTGFGASKGLWLNPPVTLRYSAGDVELGDINERIVEVPFVFETMADLEVGSRVLDVGCAESTVAFSLSSLGYDVTGIDLHPYPFKHPNLTTIVSAVEDWDCPEAYFDGIVCVSSIEHFGLGVYGEEETEGLDVLAMERISRWAKPGATLALTTPFGRYQVDAQQRTYDVPSLNRLLVGWKIEDLHTAIRLEDGTGWQVVDGERSFDAVAESRHPAVILVAAQRMAE